MTSVLCIITRDERTNAHPPAAGNERSFPVDAMDADFTVRLAHSELVGVIHVVVVLHHRMFVEPVTLAQLSRARERVVDRNGRRPSISIAARVAGIANGNRTALRLRPAALERERLRPRRLSGGRLPSIRVRAADLDLAVVTLHDAENFVGVVVRSVDATRAEVARHPVILGDLRGADIFIRNVEILGPGAEERERERGGGGGGTRERELVRDGVCT